MFWEPKFPINIFFFTTLSHFVTHDSCLIFSLFHLGNDFLTEDVGEWKKLSFSLSSKTKFGTSNIRNYYAEIGMKLSANFTGAAKTEEHFQNVLQTVKADRKEISNFQK